MIYAKIELLNQGGKPWQCFGEHRVKGFAFMKEELLEGERLCNCLIDAVKHNVLSKTLAELNGNFSAVLIVDCAIYLIADKLKCYPLLFMLHGDNLLVTDQTRVILEQGQDLRFDEQALLTYIACGYLHGSMTLVNDCHIVMAGTYVKIIGEKRIEVFPYHRHVYEKSNSLTKEEEIIEQGIKIMDKAFLRTLRTIGNRPIVIPLSGGYDSRLLACLCKKHKIPNVSCYTYGSKNSNEVVVSRQVAQTLGFPWYFVEYTSDLRTFYQDLPEIERYQLFAMNLNTVSHFQDYIAFDILKKNNTIPNNAIIMPGHSGDALGGSHIPYGLLNKKETVAWLIYHKYGHWNVLKNKYKHIVMRNLGNELNNLTAEDDYNLACSLFDNWNIQTRQANFIVNSVRIYEYNGVDWRIPLWDDEIARYWLSIDYHLKKGQRLYNDYMFKGYFEPLNVAFHSSSDMKIKALSKIKLPFGLKDYLKFKLCNRFAYFKRRYDPNNSYGIAQKLMRELDGEMMKYVKYMKYDTNGLAALKQIALLSKYIS